MAQKQSIRAAGLMSGTSADGIDVVCADFSVSEAGYLSHSVLAFDTVPYKAETKRRISNAAKLSIREATELDLAIGEEFAAAVHGLCRSGGIDPESIDIVGSHGQTIYHHSGTPGAQRASLQIGCGDTIAGRTGIPVFSDFRRKDIVLGGEGAPLTPFSDFVLYRGKAGRAILNLGGIANITVFGSRMEETRGFDTGPANAPLDRLAARITADAQGYDKGGSIALSGTVNPKLVSMLLSQDSFLQRTPPKSTGFEMYGDAFVADLIKANGGVVDASLMATAVEFTAQSIALALKQHVKTPIAELILAGGGAKNRALVEAISRAVQPAVTLLSDSIGIPADSREALAFALFAVYAVRGIPTSLPSVTGASRAAVLGKISFPE